MIVNAADWVAFAALILTVLSTVGGTAWFLSWKVSSVKTYLVEQLVFSRREVEADIDKIRDLHDRSGTELRRDMQSQFERAYRELGEAPLALREHVRTVELFIRDNYLLRKDYERDQDRLLQAFDNFSKAVEKRLDASEMRLEKIIVDQLHPKGKLPNVP